MDERPRTQEEVNHIFNMFPYVVKVFLEWEMIGEEKKNVRIIYKVNSIEIRRYRL